MAEQTQFLNQGAKKPLDGNAYEFVGPAAIAQTTTVTLSGTAVQLDAAGGLQNRRRVIVRVAGTDVAYVGFDSGVASDGSNGIPVTQAEPLDLLLDALVPVWANGSGVVTLYEEAQA